MKTLLLQYANYNYWANSRVIEMLEKAAKDDGIEVLDCTLKFSFPSLRKTLLHIWDAELIWIKRLKGESLDYFPSSKYTGDVPLRQILVTSREWIEFITSENEAYFRKEMNYFNTQKKKFSNKVYEMIHHCMNHSTFHRGQLISMLRQVGVKEIMPTDFIVYCREGKEIDN